MGEHIIQELVQRITSLERRLAEIESRENLTFNAGNITSGTLSTARYSAYADLTAEDYTNGLKGINSLVRARDLRSLSSIGIYWEDFSEVPSGWQWAGSPFVTPPTIAIINNTVLYASGFTSVQRSFYYRSVPDLASYFFLPYLNTNYAGQYAGLRLDDGTDDNYVEMVVEWQSANPPLVYRIYYRTGGGSVTTVTPTNIPSSTFLPDAIQCFVSETRWSSWRQEMIFNDHFSLVRLAPITPIFSWTPTRLGFVLKSGTSSWQRSGIDFLAW